MFLDKKAVVMSTLVTIIVIILSFGAILGVITGIQNKGEEELEGAACQATIALQKKAESIPFVDYQNSCHTMTDDIPQAPRRTVKTNDHISKEFAEKIVDTWNIVGKGEVEGLWSDDKWIQFTQSDCFVMYILTLDYVPDEGYTQQDLSLYLDGTIYRTIDEEEYTYRNYVHTYAGKGLILFPEAYQLTITNNQPSFTYINAPFEEGKEYAISVISVEQGTLADLAEFLGISVEQPTAIMFSSLEHAREKRCAIK